MDFRDLNLDKPITQSRLNLLESKGYNTVEKFVRIVPRGYYDYSKESDLRVCKWEKICISSVNDKLH